VWNAFRDDPYHGPRVVWGREVNLLLLGLAKQHDALASDSTAAESPALAAYARTLEDALRKVDDAVHASGFKHAELWSYRIENGRLVPTRYGTSSDIQLWSSTDLAVQYVLQRRQTADSRSKRETGSRKQEAGSRKQEAGNRKQETGNRKQELPRGEGSLRRAVPVSCFLLPVSFQFRAPPYPRTSATACRSRDRRRQWGRCGS
jgi:hypothetical protein